MPGYAANIPLTDPDEVHGANVTATLAAEFTNQNPTGAMPFGACLDISGIQIKGLTMNQVATRISQQMPSSGRFILNGSFGWTEEGIPALPLARATATNTWKTATESRWNEFLVASVAVLSFDEGLEGFATGDAGGPLDSAGWDSDIGNPAGSLVLDGSDLGTPNNSPNSWASRSIDIPAGAGALRFDTRATADGNGALRVLINDATLIDWRVLAGDSWVTQAANISAYAGQTVTLRFEQNDNDVGVGELRWVDNIRIEDGIPPD